MKTSCTFVVIATILHLMLNQYEIKNMKEYTIENLEQSIDNGEQFNVYNTDFEGFDILTFKHMGSNELFFIGKQCVEMLGYTNATQTFNAHISNENKCKLDHDHCTMLMDLISNEINELSRPEDSSGRTQNEDKSLISNEINPNEINELSRPIELIGRANSLKNKEIYSFNSRGATFISESGLYSLILRSNKSEALKFQDTVHRILKEIRQTGGYNLDKVPAINTVQLNKISEYMEMNSKYMEMNSSAMVTMAQLMNSNLTMDERIRKAVTPMVGSYSQALFLNPHSTVVANKTSTPTKNWSDDTTCWSAIVNLGVYAHTQRIKNNDARKALYNRMDDFEISNSLLVKTSQAAVTVKFERIINDLKTTHNKDVTDLKSEIAELNSANKQLTTEFKTVVLPNFDSLSEKINTLEEAISILKASK